MALRGRFLLRIPLYFSKNLVFLRSAGRYLLVFPLYFHKIPQNLRSAGGFYPQPAAVYVRVGLRAASDLVFVPAGWLLYYINYLIIHLFILLFFHACMPPLAGQGVSPPPPPNSWLSERSQRLDESALSDVLPTLKKHNKKS